MGERRWRKQQREWMRAYKEICELTGLKLKEAVHNNYCLVVDKGHGLFGEIGVYRYSEHLIQYFKFRGKKELVGFHHNDSLCYDENRKISWMNNVIMLLEERAELDLD